MKNIIFFFSIIALSLFLINCSDDSEDLNPNIPAADAESVGDQNGNPDNTKTDESFRPFFEASIDGESNTLINIFRDGEAINSFFNKNAVYIEVSINGNPAEGTIIFSIDRSDVGVGTYELGENSVFQEVTHLNYNATNPLNATTQEETISGSLTITNLDTTNLIMEGTFEFTARQSNRATEEFIRNIEITDGRFRLKYLEATTPSNENL